MILLVALAWAGVHVVRQGESVASIAAGTGVADAEAMIRRDNGLADGVEPVTGTLLVVPDADAGAACRPSFVRRAHGAATLRHPGESPGPVADGTVLPVGAQVCTGPEGFAVLRLAVDLDGRGWDDVVVMPESCVTVRGAFQQAGRGRSTLLALDAGQVQVMPSVGGQGDVIVATTAGVTVGDSGAFRVAVESASTRTEAVGAAVVTLAQGAQVAVPSGYGGRTEVGQAPGQPVLLPAAPLLLTPEDHTVLRRPDFTWTPVDVALGYVVEMSLTPDFAGVVQRQRVGPASWSPDRLLLPNREGGAWWRVITYDIAYFEGGPSEARWIAFPSAVGGAP